ncbi:MAG: ABC transporter substrate-binding protein [Tolumonas sp.]|nr:ABC transporter substrate-binding protein [Tolumonas sp.]
MYLLFAFLCLTLSLSTEAAPLEKITLQLRWFHQFQFAGYYAAKMTGYYRDAGLDVSIMDSKPGMEVVNEVISGRAQYGVGNNSLLFARQQGKPIVALAAMFQHSPQVFIARADAGISSVHDLSGKRIMLEPHADELMAYLKKEGVATGQLKSIFTGIIYLLQNKKYRRTDRVKAFRAASIKGWIYAMQHPDEIADVIISHYGYRDDKAHLLYEAKNMAPLLGHDNIELGYMYAERWQHIADTYAELGLLPPHFSLQILAGLRYDDLDEHARLHQELVQRAHVLHLAAIHRQMSMGELIDFIIDDLVKGHMFKQDRKFYHLFKK